MAHYSGVISGGAKAFACAPGGAEQGAGQRSAGCCPDAGHWGRWPGRCQWRCHLRCQFHGAPLPPPPQLPAAGGLRGSRWGPAALPLALPHPACLCPPPPPPPTPTLTPSTPTQRLTFLACVGWPCCAQRTLCPLWTASMLAPLRGRTGGPVAHCARGAPGGGGARVAGRVCGAGWRAERGDVVGGAAGRGACAGGRALPSAPGGEGGGVRGSARVRG